MRKLASSKEGQFVIIAALIIALMIISIGVVMQRAVTYYRHEPWEEYLALIGNVELNSKRLVELSLANYTRTLDRAVLKTNLENWKIDASKIYAGRGTILNYELANCSYKVNGLTVNYIYGLNHSWMRKSSFSVANATFTLNITSIGLSGYKFRAFTFLNLTIINVVTYTVKKDTITNVTITVKAEDNMPVAYLGIENFNVKCNGTSLTIDNLITRYDSREVLVYVLQFKNKTIKLPVEVEVVDSRSIRVVACWRG